MLGIRVSRQIVWCEQEVPEEILESAGAVPVATLVSGPVTELETPVEVDLEATGPMPVLDPLEDTGPMPIVQ